MFTLRDTETDTDTDKKWVIKYCVHCALRQQCHGVLLQFVGLGVGVCVSVGQYERTMNPFMTTPLPLPLQCEHHHLIAFNPFMTEKILIFR